MKRLIIIAEGETEEAFVNNLLVPYLNGLGIYNLVQCFKLKHSHGGISKYSHLKEDLLNVVYENKAVVSTMIDYYRLPSDFPGFDDARLIEDKKERMAFLERSIKEEIEVSQCQTFDNLIPYIQLHEFEALLFSSDAGVSELFDHGEYNRRQFQAVLEEYPDPEEINDGPATAPSVRLKRIIRGYHKVLYGVELAAGIGMETLLAKCRHFNEWVGKLIIAMS